MRLIDLAEQVAKRVPYRVANFMSPAGLVIADAVKAQYPDMEVRYFGGYEGAERVRIAFVDAEYAGEVDFGIRAVDVTWDARFRLLTHRDVLGSLMSLGLEREKFGDIIMREGGAHILTDAVTADYVISDFTKIAMVGVKATALDLSELQPKEERVKDIRTTVASMRLDAVASSGFGMSRTKLANAVNAGLLQVNWQPAKGPAQEVKEGDVISMRGRGRMKIESVTGTSRKGRIGVHLQRFM